jgi:hypothetical protein
MDKFDQQIAMLQPTAKPARLDERQFMKKLETARRAQQLRRALLAVIVLAAVLVAAGALRRNLFEIVSLTVRYLGDLPHMFGEYTGAYTASVSWPGVGALLLLAGLGTLLIRSRGQLPAVPARRTLRMITGVAVLALALGIAGLFGSPAHADAQAEALKRKLNERGHLEVQVDGNDYELYRKSSASDDSIRNQALIANIRAFDIAKAYPELKEMRSDGFISEIRAVNTDDDCIYYVERRLEPALNKVLDANSGCVRNDDPIFYLDKNLKPIKAPNWKKGQAAYMSSAKRTEKNSYGVNPFVGIIVLLDGKADDYVARSNSEKLVPKGQPGTGTNKCGIDLADTCPEAGSVDVYMNAVSYIASSDSSAITDDTLAPRDGTEMVEVFGKITALNDNRVQIITSSGREVGINWYRNVIEEFNTQSGPNYKTTEGPLRVEAGDSISIRFYYKDGMDTKGLALSDVTFINVAIKTTLPDPLQDEKYSKEKASLIEKY